MCRFVLLVRLQLCLVGLTDDGILSLGTDETSCQVCTDGAILVAQMTTDDCSCQVCTEGTCCFVLLVRLQLCLVGLTDDGI